LSGAVAKPASVNLRKLVLSPTGSINLGFILREDLLLCSSYLHLGVPNWAANTALSKTTTGCQLEMSVKEVSGKVILEVGWLEFAVAHNVKIGYLLFFKKLTARE
jgi:hypothetical protein